ncbi:MAG: hypothetical protein M3R22_09030 [Pseudomonadota bacterium]|nr:hypothetical protein [Pseudomonadota bacterium]
MAVGWLERLAAGAPVAVFAAVGRDAIERVEDLSLDARITWVASPRHADMLLVAGRIRKQDDHALQAVHDQIPAPRKTLWWGSEPFDELASPTVVPLLEDALPHVMHLRDSRSNGERDLLPDEPPNPWQGVGPNGQGGKGMMGGVPYGRSMAMTDDDGRDGLQLDQTTVQIGPFLQTWPCGLALEVVLQGDVLQRARVVQTPYGPTEGTVEDISARLRSAARVLALLQLGGLAERCRRAAAAAHGGREAVDVAALRAAVRRSGAFAAVQIGLGACRLEGEQTDVRSRLRAWLGDNAEQPEGATTAPKPKLAGLLTGLEWNEAMLVINSFTPHQLHGMAPCEKGPDKGGDDDPDGEHAAMEHTH